MSSKLLVLAIAVLMTAPLALAQAPSRTDDTTFPSGLEGERYRAFLDAVESRDLGRAEAFYDEHIADGFKESFEFESFLEGYKWIASTTGGLDFYSVRTYEPPRPNLTTVVCRDRYFGSWWAVVFHYGDDPAEGIVDLKVVRAGMPAEVAKDGLSVDEFKAELDEALARACINDLFEGTVLVASGNDVLFQHACGVADSTTGESITMDSRFEVGAMEEMFAAVAAMQLVERDQLSLDVPVGTFLQEAWSSGSAAESVTLGEVLAHASSQADSLSMAYWQDTGESIAGGAIAGAHGGDYDSYLAANVFGPAGMEDTGRSESGALRTTARDLHRFTVGLATGALLKGESIQQLWSDHSPDGTGRGYGFALRMTPRGVVVGHDGASTGSAGSFAIYTQTGHTVAILENVPGAAWPVDALIRDLMVRLE